jgi:hypothetical protein
VVLLVVLVDAAAVAVGCTGTVLGLLFDDELVRLMRGIVNGDEVVVLRLSEDGRWLIDRGSWSELVLWRQCCCCCCCGPTVFGLGVESIVF